MFHREALAVCGTQAINVPINTPNGLAGCASNGLGEAYSVCKKERVLSSYKRLVIASLIAKHFQKGPPVIRAQHNSPHETIPALPTLEASSIKRLPPQGRFSSSPHPWLRTPAPFLAVSAVP